MLLAVTFDCGLPRYEFSDRGLALDGQQKAHAVAGLVRVNFFL
ncbi:MAG: hypothetical protein Fur0043_28220 [Anaerolineales bacterium]